MFSDHFFINASVRVLVCLCKGANERYVRMGSCNFGKFFKKSGISTSTIRVKEDNTVVGFLSSFCLKDESRTRMATVIFFSFGAETIEKERVAPYLSGVGIWRSVMSMDWPALKRKDSGRFQDTAIVARAMSVMVSMVEV